MRVVACVLLPLLAAAPGATAPAGGGTHPFRLSLPVLIIAGGLLIAGIYFLIRMLEWDLINRDTPDQDDPLPR